MREIHNSRLSDKWRKIRKGNKEDNQVKEYIKKKRGTEERKGRMSKSLAERE